MRFIYNISISIFFLPLPPTKRCAKKIYIYISVQTSLEKNSTNLSYIFILSVNFENLTVNAYKISRKTKIDFYVIK